MGVPEAQAPAGGPAPPLLRQRRPQGDPVVVRRERDWTFYAVLAAIAAGVALRFIARGSLWLDEAQSVAIAGQPLHDLSTALRHDGSPPLWYALLHVWMLLFGHSTFAVRALSAVPSLLAIPVVYALGRRLGDKRVAITSAVLLAVSPFAIRYAVETRMYSLLTLLALLGAYAVVSVHRGGGWWPLVGVGAATSALLYTHYYALFFVAVVGAGELWLAWRRHDRAARRVLIAMVVGGLSFLPWLPVLAYQSAHTGAPWAPAPNLNAVLSTVDSWMGGGNPAARFASLFALGLVVLAVAGRRAGRKEMLVGGRLSWVPLRLLAVVIGTLTLAIVVDMVDREAYAPRYLATGSALFLLVVAFGIVVLPSQRARRGALTLLAVAGLGVAIGNAFQLRTQAGQVATVLNEQARAGDVVVYCPDQVGPSVSRLTHVSSRQVVYPNFASPHSVDWVDYRKRNLDADTGAFARTVQKLAGTHRIWLVYTLQVQPLAKTCADLIDQFVAMRGVPSQPVTRHPGQGETMALNRYDARR